MTKHVYPAMVAMHVSGALSSREIENLIAATAKGYPFPCNLDVDSPLSGMAPPSQQDILRQDQHGLMPPSMTTLRGGQVIEQRSGGQ